MDLVLNAYAGSDYCSCSGIRTRRSSGTERRSVIGVPARTVVISFWQMLFSESAPAIKSYSQYPMDIGNRYYNSIDLQ